MPEPTEERTRKVWAALGATGALREIYADPDPRVGLNPVRLRHLLTELDRTESVGVTLSVCVQVATAIPLLLAANAPEVTERVLDGHAEVAFAATDAVAGSDLTDLRTTVRFEDDKAVLSGTKRWIVNATTADWAIVLARQAPGREFTNFCLVLVPLDQPGVTSRPAGTTAFAGSGVGELEFTDVVLGNDAVIGGRGRGLALFARQMAGERLASGLWATAITGRALLATQRFLRARSVADQPLWQNAAVRQRFARAVVDHQLLYALGERLCRPGESTLDNSVLAQAAVLKAAGAGALERVLADCGELAGADGFQHGGIQDLRREVAMFGIAGGSTATMLDLIADHVTALLPDSAKEEP